MNDDYDIRILKNVIMLLGWDLEQWARVLAVYKDEPASTLNEALQIKRKHMLRNIGEPCGKSILVGVDPPMDCDRAIKLFDACSRCIT